MPSHSRPVLVVDDDPDILDAMSLVLESTGYPVLTARNGAEALKQLRGEARPCIILLDLMMPLMNGWQFREEQLRDPALAAIPIVVITGTGQAAREAALLGAAGYLTKPIDIDALLSTVARYD